VIWWIMSSFVDINSESRILSDHFMVSTRRGMKEITGNLVGMQLVSVSWSCFPACSAFHQVSHKNRKGFHSHPALSSEQQFFLVLKLNVSVKEHQFVSVKEMPQNLLQQQIKIYSELCMECWEKWKRCWNCAKTANPYLFRIVYGVLVTIKTYY